MNNLKVENENNKNTLFKKYNYFLSEMQHKSEVVAKLLLQKIAKIWEMEKQTWQDHIVLKDALKQKKHLQNQKAFLINKAIELAGKKNNSRKN